MEKIKIFILTKTIGFYLNILSFIDIDKAKQKAYALFSQPRKGRLKREKLPKVLLSAKQETIVFENDFFETYIWQGDEKIIVLIHGWESNASRWKKMLPYLKQLGHTIIAIDAPAHGLSSGKEFNAPKYAEFINILAQKYNPSIVIGHSIGGAAISYYLHKYQNQYIEKIVLLGSPSEFKIMSDNFINLLSLNNRIKKSLEAYYKERFNIDINEFSAHLFAKKFTYKALIAHDIDDEVVKVDEGRKYASNWKNAIYIETSGLGHSMHDSDLYQQVNHFILKT